MAVRGSAGYPGTSTLAVVPDGVEPSARWLRHTSMHVNTEALRSYGASAGTRATDIAAVAAALSESAPMLAGSFGPVGTGFAAAVAEATSALAGSLTTIADDVTSAGSASAAAALAFDDADGVARRRLDRIGF